jgi:hypothetical protein
MQSDDQFRRAFDAATVRMTAWADRHRDVATIDHERSQDFYRLSVTPLAQNACAVEVMLHRPTQTYDLQIAEDMWEGLPAPDLEMFVPLLDAIVSGHVVLRRHRAAGSGMLLKIETLVMSDTRAPLTFTRITDLGQALPMGDAIAQDQHAVPYRRD